MNKLLNERFIVEDKYPLSELPIGAMIEYDVEAAWITLNGKLLTTDKIIAGAMSSYYFSDVLKIHEYPAIFRELEWWEDRQLEDMPNYIKFVYQNKIQYVHKIERWGGSLMYYDYIDQLGYEFLGCAIGTLPATEEEFNSLYNK